MFLAFKEIKKEKTRFFMIVLVTALIAYLVYFLTGLAYGLASANRTSVDYWNESGVILSKSSNKNIYASTIDEKVVNDLNLKKAEPLNIASTVIKINDESKQFDLVVMGVEDDTSKLLPKIIEGKSIKDSTDIVISESFRKMKDISLGDKIEIVTTGREFEVVGFTGKSEYNTQPVGYVNLEMASQTMMMYTTGDKSVDASTSPTPNMPNRISALIVDQKVDEKKLKDLDLDYLSNKAFIEAIPGYTAQVLTFGLMIVSLILVASVIIGIFMYILTIQKKSIFAILKIQGISDSFISLSVIYQTLIISILGVVTGLLLTLLTYQFLPGKVPVEMSWTLTGIISLLFIVCSLVGSLFSARSVLKIDPLDAL